MTLGELATRLGGALSPAENAGLDFDSFVTDSRDVPAGSVYLAIKGERVDGHDFAHDALARGSVCAVVERAQELSCEILVPNLVDALANFGRSIRAEFTGPVVGLTGSNGKTTTKELLAAALSPLGPVLKNQGNRNTEYTSPLVWHDLTSDHRAAVIEMGMRGFGQIRHLASISQPTIAVITCIGTAHIEKVGSRQGILEAKSEILENLPEGGHAILWREDDYFGDLVNRTRVPVTTFGSSPDADVQLVGYRMKSWSECAIRLRHGGEEFEVSLNAIGRHMGLNAAAAVAAAICAGVPFADAVSALATADLPPMRMEERIIGGATYLVDTYNASPDSTVAALRALGEGTAAGKKIAVLGEMRELGDFTESGHRLVGKAIADTHPDLVLLTGGPTQWMHQEALAMGFPSGNMVVWDTLDLDAVKAKLVDLVKPGDVVLVKASRALGLEQAIPEVVG